MIREDGKVFNAVLDLLIARGVEPFQIMIATLGRGTDHLVLKEGNIIGTYNHRSRELILYEDQ